MMWPWVALACTEPSVVSGRLVDARTGRPIVGEVVRAESGQLDQARISGPSDSAGNFTIVGLLPGAEYHLVPTNPDWVLPERANAAASVELSVWQAPSSDGIFLLGEQITQLVTNSAVGQLYLDDGRVLAHPLVVPGALPHIAADEALLLAGDVTAGWTLSRLYPAPEAPIRAAKKKILLAGWWIAGSPVEVDQRGHVTVVSTAFDPAFTVTKLGNRPLQYLAGNAIAGGRYMIHHGDVSRAILVDFAGVAP